MIQSTLQDSLRPDDEIGSLFPSNEISPFHRMDDDDSKDGEMGRCLLPWHRRRSQQYQVSTASMFNPILYGYITSEKVHPITVLRTSTCFERLTRCFLPP